MPCSRDPKSVHGRIDMEHRKSSLNRVTGARLLCIVNSGRGLTKIADIKATDHNELVVVRDEFLDAPLEGL